MKTKTKSCGDEDTYFIDGEMSKVGYNYIFLTAILIDFVIYRDENYYPQVFLEE